jgi:hypothetical protein
MPLSPNNFYFKYADDGYLIIPSTNSHTIQAEIKHQTDWATSCNLKINPSKTSEIIFSRKRSKPPPPTPHIQRLTSMKILGVILDDKLNFSDHIDLISTSCSQNFFALKTLRLLGLPQHLLTSVFSSLVTSRLLYAAPAYWGFLNAHNRSRLQAVLTRAARLGYYPPPPVGLPLSDIQSLAEQKLFLNILRNPTHVLHYLLPPKKPITHNLRTLSHGLVLPPKDDRNFFPRLLYHNIF